MLAPGGRGPIKPVDCNQNVDKHLRQIHLIDIYIRLKVNQNPIFNTNENQFVLYATT